MRILATSAFMKAIEGEIDDLELWKLQDRVHENPEIGKLIRGGRGLRKIRWGSEGKGKRGGMRIIYYYRVGEIIYFVAAYRKSEIANLPSSQLKGLVKLLEDL